jgi:hypothetical protein
MKLALAFALLLVASIARADGTNVDGVIVPAGATVTSVSTVPGYIPCFCMVVSFSFADGNGWGETLGPAGMLGALNFTEPVSGFSLDWYGGYFGASDNVGDSYLEPYSYYLSTGTVEFGGAGITSIEWGFSVNSGLEGIESMIYTVADPPSAPEPSELAFLALGISPLALAIFLAGRAYRKDREEHGW